MHLVPKFAFVNIINSSSYSVYTSVLYYKYYSTYFRKVFFLEKKGYKNSFLQN